MPVQQNPCPEHSSSFLSKMLYIWFDKFAWKGYKNPLKDEDVWGLDYEMRSSTIVKRFESYWHLTLDRLQKYGTVAYISFQCSATSI